MNDEEMAMFRFMMIFIILSVLMTLGISFFGLELSKTNYWDIHGFFLLVFLTFFPRLTLLFSSIPFGGFFWWLGFIFAPHYLVAILATVNYWHQNPILVAISWFVALGGETSEKYYLKHRIKVYRYRNYDRDDVIDVTAEKVP